MSDHTFEREPDPRVRLTAFLGGAAHEEDLAIRAFYIAQARLIVDAQREEHARLEALVRAAEQELRRRLEAKQLTIPVVR